MNQYYFNTAGPTEINLMKTLDAFGWQQAATEKAARFGSKLLYDNETLVSLEHKDKFIRWAKTLTWSGLPLSYVVNDFNYQSVAEQLSSIKQPTRWILKPARLNNGVGIKILERVEQLVPFFESDQRFGGNYVLQQYIEPPLLIDNKKFSIRLFVIIGATGEVAIYHQGYLNICNELYCSKDVNNRQAHISNEHLTGDGSINSQQRLTSQWPNYKNLQAPLFQRCHFIVSKWLAKQGSTQGKLAILGVDFMLDSDERPYLLEINHGPCFPTNLHHPLYLSFYQPFWQQVVKHFILNEKGTTISFWNNKE